MECQGCGRWTAADSETGYDADTLCPACAAATEPAICLWCGVATDGDDYCSSACDAAAQHENDRDGLGVAI